MKTLILLLSIAVSSVCWGQKEIKNAQLMALQLGRQ